jgi:hypothetical protein
MSTIWERIKSAGVCKPLPLPEPFPDVLVTRDIGQEGHWLVGPYSNLKRLARQMRSDAALCELLSKRKVRFGFRETDQPPTGLKWQRAYGEMEPRASADHTAERKKTILSPVLPNQPQPTARFSDEFANVERYWAAQTPQAHHIVEFNNLRELGLSSEEGTGDLDYKQLPCVLLMAEFHQRYVSSYLKSTHEWDGKPKEVLARLTNLYQAIYRHQNRALHSLWQIAETILKATESRLK